MIAESGKFVLSTADGVNKMFICDQNTEEPLAIIEWVPDRSNCQVITIDKGLQDNVADFESYKDFIYLVDEAYYRIGKEYGVDL